MLLLRFDREPLFGFVNPHTYLGLDGFELMTTTGTVQIVPYAEVKIVCFVKDFSQRAPRREMRLFASRPKTEGLWVRLKFKDGDILDGVLANNLLLLDPAGFNIVPPDPEYRNQRLFVPRAALSDIQILGVVGSAINLGRKKPAAKEQLEMFGKPE